MCSAPHIKCAPAPPHGGTHLADLIATKSEHELVELLCPRKENKIFHKTSQHSVNFTCRSCTATWTNLGRLSQCSHVCPGPKKSRFRNLRMKAKWWALLRQHQPAHLATCVSTWKLSKAEILRLDADAKRVVSKGWKKASPLQSCAWFRNLVEDGDVEPNPGPQSLLCPPVAPSSPPRFSNLTKSFLAPEGDCPCPCDRWCQDLEGLDWISGRPS